MKLLGNKVLVRITKDNRDSIFTKEITRDDGSKVKLFLTVDAKDDEDRKSELFVQTGIIEAVGTGEYDEDGTFIEVGDVRVGDIAIVDYQVCNMKDNIYSKDDNGDVVYWIIATTTIHNKDLIAYANRKKTDGKRTHISDRAVYKKGDYNDLSMLLGIIRDDKLIPRTPYVFLEHQSITVGKTTKHGIYYEEKNKILKRRILSLSDESANNYSIEEEDNILINNSDVFNVKYYNKTIDVCHDRDIMAKQEYVKHPIQ